MSFQNKPNNFINTRATFQGVTKSGNAETLTVMLGAKDIPLLMQRLNEVANCPDGIKLTLFITPKEKSKFGKTSTSIAVDASEPRKSGYSPQGGGQRAFTPKQSTAPVTSAAPAPTASGFRPKITVKA